MDYYQRNKDSINAYNQNWLNNTMRGRMSNYKCGASQRGIEWGLSEEEFLSYWKQPCYYCGSSIRTIGLDRVDNSKGYFVDNVVPCCTACNKMKVDMTQKDFLSHIRKIAEHCDEVC